MKREFDFRLDAKDFLPLFLAFFIPCLILEVLIGVQSKRIESAPASAEGIFAVLLLAAALILLTVVLYIPILRKLVPAFHFDGEPFHFRGSIGKFLGLKEIRAETQREVVLGFRGQTGGGFGLLWGQLLLSIVTVGVYTPWALSKVGKWFLSNTYAEPS